MTSRRRIVALGLALIVGTAAAGTVAAGPATAADRTPPSSLCSRQFDAAVRSYVDTTDQRDAAGFNRLLHEEVTGVLPEGSVFAGRAEMADFVTRFFANTTWTQTFTPTRRAVFGCDSAFVLFESVYAEPATGYQQNLRIGVSWTREHGRWLVIQDQNTEVLSAPAAG